jgi:hypothetical protein
MSTITKTQVDLEHPYRAAGVIMVLLSLVVLAFSLGVLARCGGGEGVCFDTATHASGDAGLVIFVLTFIIGVALIAYTGSTASFQTRSRTPTAPAPAAPAVTNVFPQSAPAAQPAVTNVYPQTPTPAPATTVVVAPR